MIFKSSKYDYYKYRVLSNGEELSRAKYEVSVAYQHQSITKRSGRRPHLKFNTSEMLLEVYNDPILMEDEEEIVTIYVTDRISGKVYRKMVKVTWYCVVPTEINWDNPTLERVHPIVETLYDKYSYDSAEMELRGTEYIVGNIKGDGYDIYQYYFKSNVPVASNEYEISVDISSELSPYVAWDYKAYRLYVKKGVSIEGEYTIPMKVKSKYLKENNERVVTLRWGYDYTTPMYQSVFDQLTVTINGKSNITPVAGTGYDLYYYVIKSVPPLAWRQYNLSVEIDNSPSDDAVIFDKDAMVLRVNKESDFSNPCTVILTVSNIFNSITYSKTITIDNNSRIDTL